MLVHCSCGSKMCFLKAQPSLRRNDGRKPRRMAFKTWEGFLELGRVQGYLGFYLVYHGMLFVYTPCITCSLLGYTYHDIIYIYRSYVRYASPSPTFRVGYLSRHPGPNGFTCEVRFIPYTLEVEQFALEHIPSQKEAGSSSNHHFSGANC